MIPKYKQTLFDIALLSTARAEEAISIAQLNDVALDANCEGLDLAVPQELSTEQKNLLAKIKAQKKEPATM